MKNQSLTIILIVMLGLSALASGQARNPRPRPERARDPVCGLIVDKAPQLSTGYDGTTYYFCSNADRDKFKKNPHKYVKEK